MEYTMYCMPKVIEEMIKAGAQVEFRFDQNDQMFWRLGGFGKSGFVDLHIHGGNEPGMEHAELTAISRYKETTHIETVSDLVHLNLHWNIIMAERMNYDLKGDTATAAGIELMPDAYRKLAEDLGIIKSTEKTVKQYSLG